MPFFNCLINSLSLLFAKCILSIPFLYALYKSLFTLFTLFSISFMISYNNLSTLSNKSSLLLTYLSKSLYLSLLIFFELILFFPQILLHTKFNASSILASILFKSACLNFGSSGNLKNILSYID